MPILYFPASLTGLKPVEPGGATEVCRLGGGIKTLDDLFLLLFPLLLLLLLPEGLSMETE